MEIAFILPILLMVVDRPNSEGLRRFVRYVNQRRVLQMMMLFDGIVALGVVEINW